MMKRKVISLCLVVALLAVAVVGGTLAFFTDETDKYVNTFTMGDVDIDLDELSEPDPTDPNVVPGDPREDGKPGYDYDDIIPGKTYSKKPVVTVADDSKDCYAFLKMDLTQYVSLVNLMMLNEGFEGTTTQFVNKMAGDKAYFQSVIDKWFPGISHADWEIMNLDELSKAFATWTTPGSNPDELSLIFGYKTVLSAGDEVTFMKGFAVPATVTGEMMAPGAYGNGDSNINNMKMSFTGYAIQADSFDTLKDAYGAITF